MAVNPFAGIAEKYTIHPESYEYLKRGQALGVKPYHEIGVEEGRRTRLAIIDKVAGLVEFPGTEKEIIVPSPYSPDGIPISIYKPNSCPKVPAILVYFHGGGLVVGCRKTHETMLKILSRDTGAIIVNVEYRLLPQETAKMAPFEDVVVAAKWVSENKEAVGGHPDSKIGVGGDSAGGQLAITVTNDLPGQFDFQVLVYPASNLNSTEGSIKEFVGTPGLPKEAIDWFFENSHSQIPDYLTNPSINAAVRTNVATSPPALILLAELDALRDMGLEYAETLRANGVPVESHVIKGVPHAFFSLPDTFKTTCKEAYANVIRFLGQFQKST